MVMSLAFFLLIRFDLTFWQAVGAVAAASMSARRLNLPLTE
jgi:hypothetical protein